MTILSQSFFTFFLLMTSTVLASGLDVQLKDLRNSYYYIEGEAQASSANGAARVESAKSCLKLTGPEIRKYGRLLHCHPEENLVRCQLKTGESLVAYEESESCNQALSAQTSNSPTPSTPPAATPSLPESTEK